MAYTAVTRSYRLLELPFDWHSGRTGAPRALFGGSQEILSFELSPDAKSLAFTTGGTQEDLFVANADGTRVRQLTNDAERDRGVTWSPDGRTPASTSSGASRCRTTRVKCSSAACAASGP